MRSITKILTLFLLLVMPVCLPAQGSRNGMDKYTLHYNQAMRYIGSSLFAEGITELNEAIETARQDNLEQEYFQATIDLAETLRKTEDFDRGADVLQDLGTIQKYPIQEVRRLGRIAAIYHERGFIDKTQQYDSVMMFLKPAMH